MEPVTLTITDVRKLQFATGKSVTLTINCDLTPTEIGTLAWIRAGNLEHIQIQLTSLQAAFDLKEDTAPKTDPRQTTMFDGETGGDVDTKVDPVVAHVGQTISDLVDSQEPPPPLAQVCGKCGADMFHYHTIIQDVNAQQISEWHCQCGNIEPFEGEHPIFDGWGLDAATNEWHFYACGDPGDLSMCGVHTRPVGTLIPDAIPLAMQLCAICATQILERDNPPRTAPAPAPAPLCETCHVFAICEPTLTIGANLERYVCPVCGVEVPPTTPTPPAPSPDDTADLTDIHGTPEGAPTGWAKPDNKRTWHFFTTLTPAYPSICGHAQHPRGVLLPKEILTPSQHLCIACEEQERLRGSIVAAIDADDTPALANSLAAAVPDATPETITDLVDAITPYLAEPEDRPTPLTKGWGSGAFSWHYYQDKLSLCKVYVQPDDMVLLPMPTTQLTKCRKCIALLPDRSAYLQAAADRVKTASDARMATENGQFHCADTLCPRWDPNDTGQCRNERDAQCQNA